MIEKQGEATVSCEFCRESYTFSREELQAVLDEMEKGTR